MQASRREKRQTFFAAVAIALMVMLVGAPVVQAAVQAVRVKGAVKVKDSRGGTIDASAIPAMGLTDAPGSSGAVAIRTFAGGSGVLGVGDCTASTEPAQGPLPNVVTIPGGDIATALLITGEGTVRITAQAIAGGQVPLANFKVDAGNPNEVLALGNGLTATAPLTFTGLDGTACNFIVLGQGQGDLAQQQ
jgi:hypothetical protein